MTGVVLAGGLAKRMGGVDKGLVEVGGRPMVEHVLAALRPQVSDVLISANRNQARYTAYGHSVIMDAMPGFAGPLAGIASAMAAARTPLLLVVPCDGPRLPTDLGARLHAALSEAGADIAVVHDGDRLQQLFALIRTRLLTELQAYLDAGGRGVERWYTGQHLAAADFSEVPHAFVNLNDHAERERLDRDMDTNKEPT